MGGLAVERIMKGRDLFLNTVSETGFDCLTAEFSGGGSVY